MPVLNILMLRAKFLVLSAANVMSDKISQSVKIANRRGLHARASARFATDAGAFSSVTKVCKGETCVVGTSIMGLMMLGAAKGESIEISAVGSDAETAVQSLVGLVENLFDESE